MPKFKVQTKQAAINWYEYEVEAATAEEAEEKVLAGTENGELKETTVLESEDEEIAEATEEISD